MTSEPTPLTAAEEAAWRGQAERNEPGPRWTDADVRRIFATLDATRSAPSLDEAAVAEVLHRLAYSDWDAATDDPPVMDVGDLSDSGNETAFGLAERIAAEYARLTLAKGRARSPAGPVTTSVTTLDDQDDQDDPPRT